MTADNVSKQRRIVGKPWKKGQSGNPNGRPIKPKCVTSLLCELLKGDGAIPVAQALYKKMKAGDLTAIKEGLDRVEGRVPVPVSGEDGGPIWIKVIYERFNSSEADREAG